MGRIRGRRLIAMGLLGSVWVMAGCRSLPSNRVPPEPPYTGESGEPAGVVGFGSAAPPSTAPGLGLGDPRQTLGLEGGMPIEAATGSR
ncbi:MAG: hypothetical protein KatS3mg108_2814 [Isosphaeraceae bacterium]|jgi:hypothetical protein|nr:MAG: hypothetical protein KatS3mg108_2814 [Isosphaeraceae bacterium]